MSADALSPSGEDSESGVAASVEEGDFSSSTVTKSDQAEWRAVWKHLENL